MILGSQSFAYSGKFFSKTSSATDTEVDAPGDSPSNAITEWSSELTTSVPNWINPLPFSSVSLITCTRLPAV
ncbi:hypothetical protein CDFC105_64073 [Clostridioides difficile]|nr:hypothetical protein CDFC105_64073 [Clostridioides difficile]